MKNLHVTTPRNYHLRSVVPDLSRNACCPSSYIIHLFLFLSLSLSSASFIFSEKSPSSTKLARRRRRRRRRRNRSSAQLAQSTKFLRNSVVNQLFNSAHLRVKSVHVVKFCWWPRIWICRTIMSRQKISSYFKERVRTLCELKEKGENAYPKFSMTRALKEYREKYAALADGESHVGTEESVAGRIMGKQVLKNSNVVYNLHSGGEKIEVMAEAGSFADIKNGDIVGVIGLPGKNKFGELTIFPSSLCILSPCLHELSHLPKGTNFSAGSPRDSHSYNLNQETRSRKRFLDLMLNEDVRHIFETRSKIISYMRTYLDERGFQEVETPILSFIPGVGAGSPFVTKYNGDNLYLRNSPEVNLKKLLVGGLERVYEIGKQFRNEGIDRTHIPEFTSCELYMAYADYEDMMELTEDLLSGLVKSVAGSSIIKCPSNENEEAVNIDFTPPFRRIDFLEELKKLSGLILPEDLESEETLKCLQSECSRLGIDCQPRLPRMLDKLADHYLVPSCIHPTFITYHPTIMTVMAKPTFSKPSVSERFELYVNQQEMCNSYTELNNPIDQRIRFESLVKEVVGKSEAVVVDDNYCNALEHGLPPSAGWGIGVDRLVMLLTFSKTIKDVVLFPLMKPKAEP